MRVGKTGAHIEPPAAAGSHCDRPSGLKRIPPGGVPGAPRDALNASLMSLSCLEAEVEDEGASGLERCLATALAWAGGTPRDESAGVPSPSGDPGRATHVFDRLGCAHIRFAE